MAERGVVARQRRRYKSYEVPAMESSKVTIFGMGCMVKLEVYKPHAPCAYSLLYFASCIKFENQAMMVIWHRNAKAMMLWL